MLTRGGVHVSLARLGQSKEEVIVIDSARYGRNYDRRHCSTSARLSIDSVKPLRETVDHATREWAMASPSSLSCSASASQGPWPDCFNLSAAHEISDSPGEMIGIADG